LGLRRSRACRQRRVVCLGVAGRHGIDGVALLDELAAAGVDYDDVTATLEREGVEKFADSFHELLDGIRAKQGEVVAA
jgi:transaldolase